MSKPVKQCQQKKMKIQCESMAMDERPYVEKKHFANERQYHATEVDRDAPPPRPRK